MTRKPVFITGGNGFIGSYVISELLARGIEIYALTRRPDKTFLDPRITTIIGDITNPMELPPDVSTIYHCAGVITDEAKMVAVNVEGTRNIVNAAIKAGTNIVHLSSAGIVGPKYEGVICEETTGVPLSLYERTKQAAENIVLSGVSMGLKAQILRPTIVFGLGRNPENDSLIHLVRAIVRGNYRNIGAGNGVYNIIHAREVALAMLVLSGYKLPNGGIYLINDPITFNQFASIVTAALDCRKPGTIPYSVAFFATVACSLLKSITKRKMPLTFSRLSAMRTLATYSSKKLIETTTYNSLNTTEQYVIEFCKANRNLGVI